MKQRESRQMKEFSYRNEDDKAYGLAGMIITLGAFDALELVHSVSLDADGPMVEFSEEYYHLLSPSISPKSVWEAMRRNFYITSAMVVGNVMARSLVRDGHNTPDAILSSIRNVMKEEGSESLDLEEDETDMLYRHLLQRNMQIYLNPRMHSKVQTLSRRLALRRNLSVTDLISELEHL